MPRKSPVVELAMDAQAAISDCRVRVAPTYEAGLASGDFDLMVEVQALASTLRVAQKQAKRLTARAEQLAVRATQATLFEVAS